jgi:hypothetical protein
LGLQNQSFLTARQWQVQFSYQYANTTEFFVGDKRNDAAGPFGLPPRRKVITYDLDVSYAMTDRITIGLTVPYFSARGGNHQGTAQSHRFREVHTAGVGDIALRSDYLLTDPGRRGRRWAWIGLAIKAPTGADSITALNYNFNPPAVRPVDEAFQPGAGGWVLFLRAQGAAAIRPRLSAYAGGYYGLSLTEHSNVIQRNTFRAVPDTYSARTGLAWSASSLPGLTISGGARIFGITTRDVIAGRNLYFRRPGYEVFAEPAASWASGPNTIALSIPLRVYQNKQDSLLDRSRHEHIGADFVPYLIIISYARRF